MFDVTAPNTKLLSSRASHVTLYWQTSLQIELLIMLNQIQSKFPLKDSDYINESQFEDDYI